MILQIKTPRWAIPLLKPCRYKGVSGGRGSGKSHERAEALVERHIMEPDLCSVCIREIQKSLKFSAKKLIEDKIKSLGVSHLFDVTMTEIRRIGGDGLMIFQGMQDHTADSIKSLEGFGIAWVEEAQSLSARSMELLLPTIRAENSEIWFTWNPDQETDPVDQLFASGGDDCIRVHVNYYQNPHLPETLRKEAERHKLRTPDTFDHVWLGGYNTKSDDQVLHGVWQVEECDISGFSGPYYGADWGFATDPNTLVEVYVNESSKRIHISREAYATGVEIDHTPAFFDRLPCKSYVIRCDNARPEIISYMQRKGYKTQAAKKWPGSVEDGITVLRSYDITIDPSCTNTIDEARLWKYKRDKYTGDVLPKLIDGNDHIWDAVRYAIEPFIKIKKGPYFG